MKRWISLILVLLLVLGAVPMTALAANPFTDVPTYQWYYADVDNAYQNGLINGKTDTLYMPNDFLTYAEAVKLAACMNERYRKGSVSLTNGDPWYQSYVDYCRDKDIIAWDYSWNTPATRAGYMEIFANALPKSAMKEINEIPDGSIPDVPMSHPQAEAIYKLYRVGILQGNDEAHNCNPSANIKRSEVAAILTRMMDSSRRIRFSMDAEALRFTRNPESVTVEPGETAALSVKVEGGKAPYQYQWYMSRDGGRDQWHEASGKTDAAISIKTDASAAGATMTYRCKVTDAAGSVLYSDLGSVTVKGKDLKIVTQPESVRAEVGDSPCFDIEVTGGTAPYSFVWYRGEEGGGRSVNGMYGIQVWDEPGYGFSEMQVLITDNFESSAENRYFFYCVVTDAKGKQVTSRAFDISVNVPALTITNQPDSVYAYVGDAPDFEIEVTGGKAPYSFEWYIGMEGGAITVDGEWGIQTYSDADSGYSVMQVQVDEQFEYSSQDRCFFYCVVTDANGNRVTSRHFDITM